MGAWDVDAFGNDDACDWACELEASDDLGLIEQAFDAVLQDDSGFLDGDVSCCALAACEVIARLKGNWGLRSAYTEAVDQWVASRKLKPPAALVKKADEAIARVLGPDSELQLTWLDSESFDAWQSSVEELRSRVKA